MLHRKMEDYDWMCKVVLVGDSDVGKTFLNSQYINSQLPRNQTHTIGAQFASKVVPLQSSPAKVMLWDTAGQERYRSVVLTHCRKAVGVLVVYDITRESTFQSVMRWVEEVRSQADPNVVLMLVGNKRDLVEEDPAMRTVAVETAQALANSQGMLYREVAAVSGIDVNEAFQVLLEEIERKRLASVSH